MALQPNRPYFSGLQTPAARLALGAGLHDFNLQCLRILRCTAQAMANSPGGLRFKAGTRPWLEGLSVAGSMPPVCTGRQLAAALVTAGD